MPSSPDLIPEEVRDIQTFIEKRRLLAKLGGFGWLEVKMKDGVFTTWLIHQQENRKRGE